jgi:hypothetical protein
LQSVDVASIVARTYAGRMRLLRSLAWLTVLLPSLVPVAGCARVCPTIAWTNFVTVTLDGDTRNVSWVQLCTPDSCSRATETPAPQAVLPSVTASPTGANGLGFAPGGGPTVRRIIVEKIGLDSWRFGFEIDAPGSVTVRALDSTGKTLAEKETSLAWQRTDGTVGCGGPETASPVTLTVNA